MTGQLVRQGVDVDDYWQAVVPVSAIGIRGGKDIPLEIDTQEIAAMPIELM